MKKEGKPVEKVFYGMKYEMMYNNALERAREYYAKLSSKQLKEEIEEIFPELKENKNIRIIKAIKYGLDYIFTNNTTVFEVTKEQCLAWLEKQGDQRPAEWSEEERQNVDSIIAALTYCNENGIRDCFVDPDILIDCLKSLNDKLQPQPKQEWSEEDEAIYYGVIETEQYMLDVVNGIKKFNVGNISIKEECTRELNWLKSLRPRSTWKPTEEQMKVLNEVINFAADHGTMRWNDYIYNVLKGLREQLKKL